MSRKEYLRGLLSGAGEPPAPAPEAPARPVRGAVGAVSQSIEALKARAVADLDPHLIDAGGLPDRLEHDEADHAALMASIRDHGQQVPVLVRPHPTAPGRFQIVYGRRRVLALRDLGQPVKAMVRELDDREAVIAQGQENAARRDLSFIEKAHFARQMRDAGYDRKVICAALHIDKTVISRMLAIADKLPEALLLAIGAAPSVGRDRWMRFAEIFEASGWEPGEAVALAAGGTSDARFEAVLRALTLPARRARKAVRPGRLEAADGRPLGSYARPDPRRLSLSLSDPQEAGFWDWLLDRLPDLHRRWQDGGETAEDDRHG